MFCDSKILPSKFLRCRAGNLSTRLKARKKVECHVNSKYEESVLSQFFYFIKFLVLFQELITIVKNNFKVFVFMSLCLDIVETLFQTDVHCTRLLVSGRSPECSSCVFWLNIKKIECNKIK